MHTVVETPSFIRHAKKAGVTDEELAFIIASLARHPAAGDEIRGTGGARKVRFPARGKGKRGGYRVIAFYSGKDIPVFLLDVYAKGEKISLTAAEKKELKNILGKIAAAYRSTSP